MTKKKKIALIIGANGQDGNILFKFLIDSGYSIIGISKSGVRAHNIAWKTKVNIKNRAEVFNIVKKLHPDEIYYLAAFHFSSENKRNNYYDDYLQSYQINVLSLLNFLEAIKSHSTKTKLFYASSSLIFGDCRTKKQNENTAYAPNAPYGITKMDGTLLCRAYREKFGIFASVGILYNHESEYRPDDFISIKIINSALKIKAGLQKKLIVGNLNAIVDWGYAYDYVKAMNMILNSDKADEFIIASGKKHTVLDFIKVAFGYLGLDWQKYVQEDKKILYRKKAILIGDTKKINTIIGWQANVSFSDMIKKIMDSLNNK